MVQEDLEERGINHEEVAKGISMIGRAQVADLFDSHDSIWALVGFVTPLVPVAQWIERVPSKH